MSLLADAVVALHLGFVIFVVFGGLLVLRWPKLIWAHVPAALWGVWIEFAGWICPLTPLENWLRAQAGQTRYATSFVEHYLVPVLYPPALTRDVQWALGGAAFAVNLAVYVVVWRRRTRSGGGLG